MLGDRDQRSPPSSAPQGTSPNGRCCRVACSAGHPTYHLLWGRFKALPARRVEETSSRRGTAPGAPPDGMVGQKIWTSRVTDLEGLIRIVASVSPSSHFESTKRSELVFQALLDKDGTRDPSFELAVAWSNKTHEARTSSSVVLFAWRSTQQDRGERLCR